MFNVSRVYNREFFYRYRSGARAEKERIEARKLELRKALEQKQREIAEEERQKAEAERVRKAEEARAAEIKEAEIVEYFLKIGERSLCDNDTSVSITSNEHGGCAFRWEDTYDGNDVFTLFCKRDGDLVLTLRCNGRSKWALQYE